MRRRKAEGPQSTRKKHWTAASQAHCVRSIPVTYLPCLGRCTYPAFQDMPIVPLIRHIVNPLFNDKWPICDWFHFLRAIVNVSWDLAKYNLVPPPSVRNLDIGSLGFCPSSQWRSVRLSTKVVDCAYHCILFTGNRALDDQQVHLCSCAHCKPRLLRASDFLSRSSTTHFYIVTDFMIKLHIAFRRSLSHPDPFVLCDNLFCLSRSLF